MVLNLYRTFLVIFGCMLCCVTFAQSMESYERNQERLRAATFDFIENYVKTKADPRRGYMRVHWCVLQYVPERLTREFSRHDHCLINTTTVDEIAGVIGIDKALENFTAQYEIFQKSNLVTKRMSVSNYLYGCVFQGERESIALNEQSRIDGDSADKIAEFLNIKN